MSDLRLVTVPPSDLTQWDELVLTSHEGSLFMTSSFLSALRAVPHYSFIKEGDKVVAGFLGLRSEKDGSWLNSPYGYTMYQGFFFAPCINQLPPHSRFARQNKIIEFFVQQWTEQYDRLTFCTHHNLSDIRQFIWHNYHLSAEQKFKVDVRHTALLDLQTIPNFDSYLKSIRDCRRYEYRRCLKEGYKIKEGTIEDFHLFKDLTVDTFKRQNIDVPAEQLTLLENISKRALLNNFGTLLFCMNAEEEALSATLFVYDKNCGYYLMSANSTKHRHKGANTLLLIENIKRCMEKKLKYVDFIGANSPGRGDFKISCNGTPKAYYVLDWKKN